MGEVKAKPQSEEGRQDERVIGSNRAGEPRIDGRGDETEKEWG